jgi:DNA-binding winged helix-turn-helix (wHTH) protein
MDNPESALTVRFGRFLLDSRRRELLADGVPVPIGSRAFDVLIVLIEAGGQLVTKDELLDRVWPGRIVEENCLQFQISTLRKALASDRDFIKTIAGRGYRFIADISTHVDSDVASFTRRGASLPSTSIPASGLIGHEEKSAGLADLAEAQWIVTPGSSSHPELVFRAVATVLHLAEAGPVTSEGVGAASAPKLVLLLHPIGSLTFGSQGGALLAETSRSRLRPASWATSHPRGANYEAGQPTRVRTRGPERAAHLRTTCGRYR